MNQLRHHQLGRGGRWRRSRHLRRVQRPRQGGQSEIESRSASYAALDPLFRVFFSEITNGPRHLAWHQISNICHETCGIVLWAIKMCGNVWDPLRASPGMIFGPKESLHGLGEHSGAFSRLHRGLRRSGATSGGPETHQGGGGIVAHF